MGPGPGLSARLAASPLLLRLRPTRGLPAREIATREPSARSDRSRSPARPCRPRAGLDTPHTRTPADSHSHPHGSPQMSHVIPLHVIQTLKSGRCNSNVFRAYRKLTEGNYVRHFRGVRVLPATRPGLARRILSRIVVARDPPATPVTPVGAPNREPHPLHSRERPARRQRSYERSGEPCRPLTGRPWMDPCRRTRPHHETRARRRCRP